MRRELCLGHRPDDSAAFDIARIDSVQRRSPRIHIPELALLRRVRDAFLARDRAGREHPDPEHRSERN